MSNQLPEGPDKGVCVIHSNVKLATAHFVSDSLGVKFDTLPVNFQKLCMLLFGAGMTNVSSAFAALTEAPDDVAQRGADAFYREICEFAEELAQDKSYAKSLLEISTLLEDRIIKHILDNAVKPGKN